MARALAPAAADRFSSALEFANALTGPAATQPGAHPSGARATVAVAGNRRTLLVAATAGILVIAILIALASAGRLG